MTGSRPSIPWWVASAIPVRHREDLLGDLMEEYEAEALPRLGVLEANRWFRRELRRSALASLWARGRALSARRGSEPSPQGGGRTPRPWGGRASLLQDLRFGVRSLAAAPTFTLIAVLTLSLGIGASTALFSVLDGVMLKPLPFTESHRLVVPWETYRPREILEGLVSYPNLEEWERRNRVFEGVAGFHPEAYTLTGLGLPERIRGAQVTADFLQILGVRPLEGRLFLPEDDQEGAADVVVVSAGFWSRHFRGAVLGGTQSLTLSDRVYTVVGVLPPDFDLPLAISGVEVLAPAAQDFASFSQREWPRLIPLARLREGVRLDQAQADMERVARELGEAFPETNTDHGANVVYLHRQVSARVTSQLLVLLGAVGLVLFVACMNVANLLLARGMDRQRELGVRSALGAGRGRVVRQLLAEGLVLSAMGGILGVALAWSGTRGLVSLLPADYPRIGEITVDWRTLAFAAGMSVLTCLFAALLPALRSTGRDIHANLREGIRASSSRRQRRIRQTLVVAEVALAVVVLVGAGLLVRSFQRMQAVDPGFNPENVLVFQVATTWSQMQVFERAEFYSEVSRRLAALPGVVAAGAGTAMPMAPAFGTTFQHDGEPEIPRGERPSTIYLSVTPTYFETLQIPLLRGQLFGPGDQRDTPGVVVVNQAAARQFWPEMDPLGQRIRPAVDITDVDPVLFEVVGVVGDVRDRGLDVEARPILYVPHTQQTWPNMTFALRTEMDPESLMAPIRELVNELAQEASFSFQGLSDRLARSTEERRFVTLAMGSFGLMALILAAVGVFGVLSYSVTQRTRELGLRRVLGADRSSVMGLVFRESGFLLGAGAILGLAVSVVALRIVESLLFGVTATDPLTYLFSCGLLVTAGALATYLPARRATRVDPMAALKAE